MSGVFVGRMPFVLFLPLLSCRPCRTVRFKPVKQFHSPFLGSPRGIPRTVARRKSLTDSLSDERFPENDTSSAHCRGESDNTVKPILRVSRIPQTPASRQRWPLPSDFSDAKGPASSDPAEKPEILKGFKF